MNMHTVNAEEKSQRDVWIAAGVRTPFVRVDGPLLQRDSLSLSVPVARAMAEQVKGPIDFAVWGPVILNLAYNNLAREVWLEAKLEPHDCTKAWRSHCNWIGLRERRSRGRGIPLAAGGGAET